MANEFVIRKSGRDNNLKKRSFLVGDAPRYSNSLAKESSGMIANSEVNSRAYVKTIKDALSPTGGEQNRELAKSRRKKLLSPIGAIIAGIFLGVILFLAIRSIQNTANRVDEIGSDQVTALTGVSAADRTDAILMNMSEFAEEQGNEYVVRYLLEYYKKFTINKSVDNTDYSQLVDTSVVDDLATGHLDRLFTELEKYFQCNGHIGEVNGHIAEAVDSKEIICAGQDPQIFASNIRLLVITENDAARQFFLQASQEGTAIPEITSDYYIVLLENDKNYYIYLYDATNLKISFATIYLDQS